MFLGMGLPGGFFPPNALHLSSMKAADVSLSNPLIPKDRIICIFSVETSISCTELLHISSKRKKLGTVMAIDYLCITLPRTLRASLTPIYFRRLSSNSVLPIRIGEG